jgi:hypothetical protein
MRRRHKYGAKPTVVDGVRFASKREAARYQELRLLERAGEISSLLLQPKYGLYPYRFASSGNTNLGKVGDYVGDFQYRTKDGETVVEDVKGVKLPIYRLKKKWVEASYGIQIREV